MNLSRSRPFRLIGAAAAGGVGICVVPVQGASAARCMAERAYVRTIQVEAPCAAFLTNPGAVTGLIRDAAQTVK